MTTRKTRKTKDSIKKLSLNKENLRRRTSEQMRSVAGGCDTRGGRCNPATNGCTQ
jgi:hypothetical protein